MTFLSKPKGQLVTSSPVALFVDAMRRSQAGSDIPKEAWKTSMSMESASVNDQDKVYNATGQLKTTLENIARELNVGAAESFQTSQYEAMLGAGLMAADPRGVLERSTGVNMVSTESQSVVMPSWITDSFDRRVYAAEAYEDRENQAVSLYSIAYNMAAARQDEFGEAIFPTITVSQDQVGFAVQALLMMVFDQVTRRISGAVTDFNKKNLIRALADGSILKRDATRVVPVVRPESAAMFVPSAYMAPAPTLLEGESINTAPLAFGRKIDLLGISQTDTLVAGGLMDQTDSLDPAVSLTNVYIAVGADKIMIPVENLPLTNFVPSGQNNSRVQNLNFVTGSILLNKDSRAIGGGALADLADIDAQDFEVRLEMMVNGTVNVETGELQATGGRIGTYSIRTSTGTLLDLNNLTAGSPAEDVVNAIATATFVGYDVKAYRSNLNRRQRGQLIDSVRYNQIYQVPLRSPITALRPITEVDRQEATDLQTLIATTRVRVHNEAVDTLINTAEMLRRYVDSGDVTGNGPDVLGVGRFFVRPSYFEETLNLNTTIDSLKSHERIEDLRAVLTNKIRFIAARLYLTSEYKAADEVLSGGQPSTPTVVVATDPELAQYIQVDGEVRALGPLFQYRIVSSLSTKMRGKIFIVFGKFDGDRNAAPNPLNFGNLAWAPELVVTAQVSRGQTTSRETVVQPRYLFVVNCPIMGLITVTGLPDVFGKVTQNTHPV